MEDALNHSYEVRTKVTNDLTAPLLLIIEPWAQEIMIEPGDTYDVIFYAPDIGHQSVSHGVIDGQSYIIVGAWHQAIFAVYHDGQCILTTRVPSP